jgi:hypothetical protein
VYAVAVKVKIKSLELNAFEMSMYNGVWSNLILIPLAIYQGIGADPPVDLMIHSCLNGYGCWIPLIISGPCCFVVSVTGFIAHDMMSPISFVTFNNINKLPATLLSYVIWPALVTHTEIFGMASSLWGGYMYALSTQEKPIHIALMIISTSLLITGISLFVTEYLN